MVEVNEKERFRVEDKWKGLSKKFGKVQDKG